MSETSPKLGELPGSTETLAVTAADHPLATELEGEVVILNAQTSKYYTLDGVGAFLWQRIRQSQDSRQNQQPVTFRALCDAVISTYDVTPERCEGDVRALLSELAEAGLVTLSA